MGIARLRSPYASTIQVNNLPAGQAAYADTWSSYIAPYTFVGDGTAGTVNGATYRVHAFEYAVNPSYSITFNQAGNVDVLVCGGGGAGGGCRRYDLASDQRSQAGGGGGAGGLILEYNYGVSATTYNITVGSKGVSGPWDRTADSGGSSTFGSLTALGGGGGGGWGHNAGSGGSGGGSGAGWFYWTNPSQSRQSSGGSGSSGQGNPGGNEPTGWNGQSSGGGGYSEDGYPASHSTNPGKGGDGLTINFDGTSRTLAAGGGGSSSKPGGSNNTGGAGGNSSNGVSASGYGSGGGGAYGPTDWQLFSGGQGSHGLVLVRYRIG